MNLLPPSLIFFSLALVAMKTTLKLSMPQFSSSSSRSSSRASRLARLLLLLRGLQLSVRLDRSLPESRSDLRLVRILSLWMESGMAISLFLMSRCSRDLKSLRAVGSIVRTPAKLRRRVLSVRQPRKAPSLNTLSLFLLRSRRLRWWKPVKASLSIEAIRLLLRST